MDRLESLANNLSQITMYDLKSYYNQARNVVLNISEMEAKVREATNDEPWGASSTLMQEIAQGTFNFQNFNEIMPCIYARFMEKEARQWREIYKALQLLEYLIKHGSERVVDDARSHVSTIKMLRNFHYIDDKGKDEGINVRNRSKEIYELLSDVEKIRTERRKAKANKSKYTGIGNDAMSGGFSTGYSGGSYSGGNNAMPGRSNYSSSSSSSAYNPDRDYDSGGSYSNGGGGGGSSAFSDRRSARFEEYTAGDDADAPVQRSPTNATRTNVLPQTTSATATTTAPAAPLFDLLGDDDFSTPAPPASKALPSVKHDEDDFDDFKSAPSASTPAPPALAKPVQPVSLMDMLNSNPGSSSSFAANPGPAMGTGMVPQSTVQFPRANMPSAPSTMFQQPMAPNYMSGGTGLFDSTAAHFSAPSVMRATSSGPAPVALKPASGSNFDDLWSMSLGAPAKPASNNASAPSRKSIKDLEREKAQAGIWGGGNGKPAGAPAQAGYNNFGSGGGGSGGGDDLLL